MSQENSGQIESKVEGQYRSVIEVYENYISSLKLKTQTNSDVELILNMSTEERSRLSPEQCVDNAMILAQTAFFVQKELNKHIMTIEWADKKLDYLTAQSTGDYDRFTKYDIKKLQFVKENTIAQKLYQIIKMAEVKKNAISFLPSYLKNMSDIFISLYKAKVNEK